MKKLVIGSTLALMSLSADYHEPSATFTIDNTDAKFFYQLDLKLSHQSTFELFDNDALILHALSNPRWTNSYHHEVGVGYRKMFDNFGFGTNIVYANQYAFRFFNHQMVPGLEFFYKDLTVAYNRYLPVKTSVQKGDETYLFHDVSEISLSYRLWEKIQVGFTPFFNHQTKRFGYGGVLSTLVFDNIELSLAPYCEPHVQHGIAFSIGYHFGGPKEKTNANAGKSRHFFHSKNRKCSEIYPIAINSPLSKSHRFFFTKNQKEVEKFTPKPAPIIMPVSVPMVINKIDPEEKRENEKEKEKETWWEKFAKLNP